MALFNTPTKSQLIERPYEFIKSFIFFKLGINRIDTRDVTEISLISVHMNELKNSMESHASNSMPPRVLDKLHLTINPGLPSDKHLEYLNKFNMEMIIEAGKKKFDSDAVGLILSFLSQQEEPICLLCHNGFRMDFPILQREIQNLGCTLNEIVDTDLLCADSLWTFKQIDSLNQEISRTAMDVSILDMMYYTQQSLYNRISKKSMPDALSVEELNMYLLELVLYTGESFLHNLCCKKFSFVKPSHQRSKLRIPRINDLDKNEGEGKVDTFVFLDLETTGLIDPKITEICLLAVHQQSIVSCTSNCLPRIQDKLVIIVNPYADIDKTAAALSGLSNSAIQTSAKSRFCSKTALLLAQFLQRQPGTVCLVAHNGDAFDFPILRSHLTNSRFPIFTQVYCSDSLHAARHFASQQQFHEGVAQYSQGYVGSSQQLPSCALSSLYQRYVNNKPCGKHEAEADVYMLLKIALACDGMLDWLDENKKIFIV